MRYVYTFTGLLAMAALLAVSEASAQSYDRQSADLAAYRAGLRIDRSMLAGPLASSPRPLRMDGTVMEYEDEHRVVNLVGKRSGLMLEMARTTPDGNYVRPRLIIGRHSDELKSWMNAAGISADRCMLPVLRSRLKRAPETGKTSAAFLVSARCSFY
jgi:hypothetical protein